MAGLSTSAHFIAYLTILCITSQISPIQAFKRPTRTTPTHTDFLRKSCKVTLYPELCYKSLTPHASAFQTSSLKLANASLSVTLSTTRSTTAMITQMSNGGRIRPKEAGALRDCLEELHDSVNELQTSMNEMGHMKGSRDLGLKISNVQTWVSAALTDENTCMDEFSDKDMDGKLKNVMRGKIVNIIHLTSNSLALINRCT